MTGCEVLFFSGNGSFDHEADTKQAALVLVLPRSEEDIACSIFREGALFSKRTSLRAGKRCPLTAASQSGEGERRFV